MIFSDIDFIDRIAVIVDEGIIMESEVNKALKEQYQTLKQNNTQIPPKNFYLNGFRRNDYGRNIITKRRAIWSENK